MKKFTKWFMMLSVLVLATGFASCSKDDDPEGGDSKGNMIGWIEIDGKKYNFKYCYDIHEKSQKDDYSFMAASIDIDSKTPTNKDFDLTYVGLFEESDGNIDYNIEFINGFNFYDESDVDGYYAYSYDRSGDVTFTRDGDKLTFKGENVLFHSGESGRSVTGSFHFEGKPRQLKNATFE